MFLSFQKTSTLPQSLTPSLIVKWGNSLTSSAAPTTCQIIRKISNIRRTWRKHCSLSTLRMADSHGHRMPGNMTDLLDKNLIIHSISVDSCHCELILGNMKIYLQFLSCHSTQKAKVFKFLPCGKQWIVYLIVHTIVTDDLATQEARTSATVIMTLFSWNILFPCQKG